jgi:hypothetical protein
MGKTFYIVVAILFTFTFGFVLGSGRNSKPTETSYCDEYFNSEYCEGIIKGMEEEEQQNSAEWR